MTVTDVALETIEASEMTVARSRSVTRRARKPLECGKTEVKVSSWEDEQGVGPCLIRRASEQGERAGERHEQEERAQAEPFADGARDPEAGGADQRLHGDEDAERLDRRAVV